MLFQWQHPRLSSVDCRHCWQYEYDEKTWEVRPDPRNGEPLRRIMGPPCTMRRGCPKGHIDNQKSLTAQNRLTVLYYHECSAIGEFPDDDRVRRNAGLLRQIEVYREQMTQQMMVEFVKAMSMTKVSHGTVPGP